MFYLPQILLGSYCRLRKGIVLYAMQVKQANQAGNVGKLQTPSVAMESSGTSRTRGSNVQGM